MQNPFKPAAIAASPEDFFGRVSELRDLERSLMQGSVAIQGPVGIGKSSLLARARLMMEGFASGHNCETVVAVGDRDVKTVDQAARLLLECFTDVDEQENKIKFSLGSLLEIESGELCRQFAEGRHLAALKRILQRDHLHRLLAGKELLVLAVDEADKCPSPIARLFRSLLTQTQQQGIDNVRFLLAGVSPFVQQMAAEDAGVTRFIYRTLTLSCMDLEEAHELVEAKFAKLVSEARRQKMELRIDPSVVRRIVHLSGGHPHVLQLLGAHVVEHEIDDPDGVIDARDFHDSLRRICFEDRVAVYQATLHHLYIAGRFDDFLTLLGLSSESPYNICPRGFPTRIDLDLAKSVVTTETLNWMVQNNILCHLGDSYGLIDEFLRVRISFDQEDLELRAARTGIALNIEELRETAAEIGALDPRLLQISSEIDEDQ